MNIYEAAERMRILLARAESSAQDAKRQDTEMERRRNERATAAPVAL